MASTHTKLFVVLVALMTSLAVPAAHAQGMQSLCINCQSEHGQLYVDWNETSGSNTDTSFRIAVQDGTQQMATALMAKTSGVTLYGTTNLETLECTSVQLTNLTIQGNTLQATDPNGDIVLVPKGSGAVKLAGNKRLDLTGVTLVMDNDAISGDKIEGGTINAITINTLTSTTINVGQLRLTGDTLSNTAANGDIVLSPNGSGVVRLASGKTLDLTGSTLVVPDNFISGDKVEGGTINAIAINTLTSGQVTVDNLRLDGNTLSSLTGSLTLRTNDGSAVIVPAGETLDVSAATLTLADNQISGDKINGGTVDELRITRLNSSETDIGTLHLQGDTISTVGDNQDIVLSPKSTTARVRVQASHTMAFSGATLDLTGGTLVLDNDEISGDKVEGGTINAITINTLTSGQVNADNLRLDGNTVSSTNANGHIVLTPNGAGNVVVTVGKSLDLTGATLILDNDEISGDKVEGGTINAITINTLTSGQVNADNVRLDNNEVSTISGNQDLRLNADGTGQVRVVSGKVLNASSTTVDMRYSVVLLDDDEISGDKVEGGTINAITINTLTSGQVNADNLRLDGNTLMSTDTNGNIVLTPNGGGQVVVTPGKTLVLTGATLVLDDDEISGDKVEGGTINAITINTLSSGQVNADNLRMDGNSVTSTDANGHIVLTPNGAGKVVITAGKSLDLTGATLILDNDEISGDKVEGGTINAITINTLTSGQVNADNLRLDGNTLSSTNANGHIVLTPNGAGNVVVTAGKSLDLTGATLILDNDEISGDKVEGGTINAITINTLTSGQVNADNLRMDGNTLSSTDANGNIILTPNGSGNVTITPGKTLDLTNATLILDDDEISGDKVEGGTINAITINTLTSGQVNADNLRLDNNRISVTNVDGNLYLTANGQGEIIFEHGNTLNMTNTTLILDDDEISGDKVEGGTINAITINTLTSGQVNADNLRMDGNTLSSTNANGHIVLTPNGAGNVVLTAGHSLDLTGATLILDNDEISGDKVEGGTINAITINTLTSGQINADNLRMDDNTISSTNANGHIILTPNGAGKVIITPGKTLDLTNATLILDDDEISGDKVEGGTIDEITINVLTSQQIDADNLRFDGNTISSTNAGGDIIFAPAHALKLAENRTFDMTNTTLLLDDDEISGDKVEGGTINNITIRHMFSEYVQVDNLQLDGNSISALDPNGSIYIMPSGSGRLVLQPGHDFDLRNTTLLLDDDEISGDKVEGGTITNITITTLYSGQVNVDNLRLDGNTLSALNANGDVVLQPDGTGRVYVTTRFQVDNLHMDANVISSVGSNQIVLAPNGTGKVVINPGSTLDLTSTTLLLDDDEIHGDKVEGGTINAITINTLYSGQVNTDNLRLDGNTLSTTSGNLIFNPSGSQVVFQPGKNIDLRGTTLLLDNDEISGDKIEGGTISSITINTLSNTNLQSITINALTVSALTGSITTATAGILTVDELQLNGQTISTVSQNADLILDPQGGGKVVVTAGKSLDLTGATLVLDNDEISGDKVEGGTINAITINTLTSGQVNADNLRMDGNTLSSTDANGHIVLTPNGAGNVVLTAGHSLDLTGATLILDDDEISGDKVEGGTINAITINTLTNTESTIGNLYMAENNLTTTQVNGTINIVPNGAGWLVVQPGTTVDLRMTTLLLDDDEISGDKVEGGTIDAINITQLTNTESVIGNLRMEGNNISAVNAGGDIVLVPAEGGAVVVTPGRTLDLRGVTVLLSNDSISADSVEGGVVESMQVNSLTSTLLNIDGMILANNSITVDTPNADLVLSADGTGKIVFAASKTVDLRGNTLLLDDDEISGDKVEGGTISNITINTLTSDRITVGDLHLETNTLTTTTGGLLLTSASNHIAVTPGTVLDLTNTASILLNDNSISGDKIEGGRIANTTIDALYSTTMRVGNTRLQDGELVVTQGSGDLRLDAAGSGKVHVSTSDLRVGVVHVDHTNGDVSTVSGNQNLTLSAHGSGKVRVAPGETLDLRGVQVMLDDDAISGDKVEGGSMESLNVTQYLAVEGELEMDNLIVYNNTLRSKNNASIVLSPSPAAGFVGIGTETPQYLLQVGTSGDGSVAVGNAWNLFSDARLKKDVQPLHQPLTMVNRLRGVSFKWKRPGADEARVYGFIAQEMEAVVPELVHTGADGIKSVDYGKMTAVLTGAVTEHEKSVMSTTSNVQERLDELHSSMAHMDSSMHDAAKRMDAIEARMAALMGKL